MKISRLTFVAFAFYLSTSCIKSSDEVLRGDIERAVYNEEIERIRQLLAQANREKISLNEGKRRPLHVATERGRVDIVHLLLNHGCDPNQRNAWGESPLHVAAKMNFRVLAVLVAFGADIEARNSENFTALDIAAHHGNVEAVKRLLEKGASMNARIHGGSPLHLAAARDHENVVSELLKSEQNLNQKNGDDLTALEVAAFERSQKCAKLLRIKGAKLTLPAAVAMGEHDFVSAFISSDPGVISWKRSTGESLLHLACHFSDEKMLNILISSGCDPYSKDLAGEFPLHEAARTGFLYGIKSMVGPKIVNSRNRKGETPMYVAVAENQVAVVRILLNENADPNIQDKDGKSALIVACDNNNAVIAEMLIEKKATPNCRELTLHWTPLHYAVYNKNAKLVRMLMGAGANPTSVDIKGKTPANWSRDVEIHRLLNGNQEQK